MVLQSQDLNLFSKATSSCPARCGCYHILQHVSQLEYPTKCHVVNLTTLLANKKSEWKRPRIDDMDVMSTADAEPHHDVIDEDDCATTTNAKANQMDVCYAYNLEKAPARQTLKSKTDKWIACEKCNRWYHELCVGLNMLKRIPKSYECDFCKIT